MENAGIGCYQVRFIPHVLLIAVLQRRKVTSVRKAHSAGVERRDSGFGGFAGHFVHFKGQIKSFVGEVLLFYRHT